MSQCSTHKALLIGVLLTGSCLFAWTVDFDSPAPAAEQKEGDGDAAMSATFDKDIKPLIQKLCVRCHNADNMESGVRVDHLDGSFDDRHLRLWKAIRKHVLDGVMPPEDELQPTDAQRALLDRWIETSVGEALSRNQELNGSIRRLTVAQYRNTIRDLLGIDDDLTGVLPPDAVSKDGFLNNGAAMLLSPLLVESYFEIAEKALDLSIVDVDAKPVIQNFRMDLGAGINADPCPDKLILGALSHLLQNQDFQVTELKPEKAFPFRPFAMQRKFRFIEGYQGNDTVRGWRDYDSIYHAVFACMRGTEGYPLGKAYETVPEGLLLRPAIPSTEIFGESSTYGPRANFKISLRELPDTGTFRVTVVAKRYDDGLLLPSGTALQPRPNVVVDISESPDGKVMIPQAGIYQIDLAREPEAKPAMTVVKLGDRVFSAELSNPPENADSAAFLRVRLLGGELPFHIQMDGGKLTRARFTRLEGDSAEAKHFAKFEERMPVLGVHVGLRRDCGSTLNPVGRRQAVRGGEFQSFVFTDAISKYPSPDVEKNNVNYLAGVREIGVRSEYTDGRDMPRLLIRSIEFEGPYYESWPPRTHRSIFIESDHPPESPEYAREVIVSFASRAFRRPLASSEVDSLLKVWNDSFSSGASFPESIKETLLVVLTSPQFLFLIESSETPEAEDLDEFELASKLSYFLWNAAPDEELLAEAERGTLRKSLTSQVDRLVADTRFHRFADEFASQWLSLDKFDVVKVDDTKYPKLTRDTKTELRKEPAAFLGYLMRENLPLRNLVQSDFIVANEVVAAYYGLGDQADSGYEFVPIRHESTDLGGILTQASILSGLSDGTHSNPVKRGAWFARKMIADPPDDPPPNVPELSDDDEGLTLREKLELHRNQKGCAKCHAGIDPWGLPFETHDAGGLLKGDQDVDARSILPDGTELFGLNALRDYLVDKKLDRVAYSALKHLATYAIGRSLSYREAVLLEKQALELRSREYRMRDMIQFVVHSDLFLKK